MNDRVPLIDASGLVVNLVVAGDAEWSPPEGLTAGPPGGNIGDTWDGTQYIPAAAEPVE